MTSSQDPHRLVVAVEDAVKALTARAKLAGIPNPEPWAREYVDALRRQGWRPWAPVTALPKTPARPAQPPADLLAQTKALLRAARPTEEPE